MGEGTLQKRSRHLRCWRRRWAVLTADALSTFNDSEDIGGEATEVVELACCRELRADGDAGLLLITPAGEFAVHFACAAERHAWACIAGVIRRHQGSAGVAI